ncbi:hypothetical protein PIB30_106381 [Stylosanthes scabra]|uniref:DUF1985 domain-containing protein n=1 Tax=Stylosanthes scabra TaxID=79078 RepID=A0ABU6YZF8_9FABA|nr:hypothetical protein [Stylosanthes scabra]
MEQSKSQSKPKPRKVHYFSRCSPSKIVELKNLILADKSRLKEEAVREMGFGFIFHIDCIQLNLQLCAELVKHIDPDPRIGMRVKGFNIPIQLNDVGLVFDLPTQGDIVPKTEDLTDDAKKVVKHFKGLSFGALKDMLAKDGVDDAWRRALILYILGSFLCPTSKNQPSPKLLGSIFGVKNPRKYNWGEFTFKWLMEMIHVYKQKNVGGSIGGCIFMLMILYFDARKFGRADRRHE